MFEIVQVSKATIWHFIRDIDIICRAVCIYECLDNIWIQMAQLSQLLFDLLVLLCPYFNGAKENLLCRLRYSGLPNCRIH